jgi:putative glutamine amidotransferase
MTVASGKPVVLIPACNHEVDGHACHLAGLKYTDVVRLVGALPLIVPNALPDERDVLLDLADGVLLTGSPSNVHPSHFDETVHDPSLPLDILRDAWTLWLIPRALARGVPLLAICRGAQETNVALGGSLHQAVHEVDGHLDHRDEPEAEVDAQYAPAHVADVVPGGVLARVVGRDRIEVNSLHGQAVKRLADGLVVEARAPDGVIEAFSKPDAPGFNLAVQWHPEWHAASDPVSRALFAAFGTACAQYRQRRSGRFPIERPAR